jgi:magnesium transporter
MAQKSSMPADPTDSDAGCALRLICFDFADKREFRIDLGELRSAFEREQFVWIDVIGFDAQAARASLVGLGLVSEDIIDVALTREAATQIARYDDYVHFVISDCRLSGHALELVRIDCVMAARFLLTIHRSGAPCLDAVRRNYPQDFQRFAQTPGFLIYEIWDQLLEGYIAVQRALEDRVDELRIRLVAQADDEAFRRVAELSSDLLNFRKVLLPARAVLHDLGTRRSLFLSSTTQPFLLNLVGTVEHVQQELLVDRDILAGALDLHMSLVAHRTNTVMKKLTVVSVIFLPLTFLCGVYGMNFRNLPELDWSYGYALFWFIAGAIAALVAWLCRRARLW